ncbi:MAG: chemotaxis protein CheW [Nitrospinota bacterium]|nr:chemotaxis protein CheW [Nitrospinota bacterium]MDH5755892.1 chemotaxis protein CheW [Nitrospinota bacterium]
MNLDIAASIVNGTFHNSRDLEGKYLTFVLGREEYAFEIKKVMEIIGIMDVTRVPKAPKFIKGVINLRGKVIPIVDLRTKFRMHTIDYTKETCIVVVETSEMVVGVIVDSVSEVIDINMEDIESSPAFGEEIDVRYILGMAKVNDEVKILINIDKVLSQDELEISGHKS